jgi:hypothetical protein
MSAMGVPSMSPEDYAHLHTHRPVTTPASSKPTAG